MDISKGLLVFLFYYGNAPSGMHAAQQALQSQLLISKIRPRIQPEFNIISPVSRKQAIDAVNIVIKTTCQGYLLYAWLQLFRPLLYIFNGIRIGWLDGFAAAQ